MGLETQKIQFNLDDLLSELKTIPSIKIYDKETLEKGSKLFIEQLKMDISNDYFVEIFDKRSVEFFNNSQQIITDIQNKQYQDLKEQESSQLTKLENATKTRNIYFVATIFIWLISLFFHTYTASFELTVWTMVLATLMSIGIIPFVDRVDTLYREVHSFDIKNSTQKNEESKEDKEKRFFNTIKSNNLSSSYIYHKFKTKDSDFNFYLLQQAFQTFGEQRLNEFLKNGNFQCKADMDNYISELHTRWLKSYKNISAIKESIFE